MFSNAMQMIKVMRSTNSVYKSCPEAPLRRICEKTERNLRSALLILEAESVKG